MKYLEEIKTEEERASYEEFDEFIDVDLNYILGGLLTRIYEIEL